MDNETKEDLQREMILDAVHKKFLRHGVRRVTLSELSQELRISKKTLYQYFDSKEALVRACIDRVVAQVFPRFQSAIRKEGTAMARLFGAWEALSILPSLVSPEFFADIKADYPLLWEEIDSTRHGLIAEYEQMFHTGIEQGEINEGINPRVLMRLLIALIERVVTPEIMVSGEYSQTDVMQTVYTLFTQGLFRTAEPS